MSTELPTLASASYQTRAFDPLKCIDVAPALGAHELFVAADSLSVLRPGVQALQHLKPTSQGDPMPNTRIVKVFIADTDENVPLDKRLLYKGDEQFTDLTDQELFFEIPVSTLLVEHNNYRKTVTKHVGDKDVPLEPIRIRDLKMVVVNVAQF